MRLAIAILWKDLLCEWRSRDRVAAMLLFSLLVVTVFHFALPEGTGRASVAGNAPGLLWVAFIFASLLVFLPFMMTTLTGFTHHVMDKIVALG